MTTSVALPPIAAKPRIPTLTAEQCADRLETVIDVLQSTIDSMTGARTNTSGVAPVIADVPARRRVDCLINLSQARDSVRAAMADLQLLSPAGVAAG